MFSGTVLRGYPLPLYEYILFPVPGIVYSTIISFFRGRKYICTIIMSFIANKSGLGSESGFDKQKSQSASLIQFTVLRL